jgi:hypothetical protein
VDFEPIPCFFETINRNAIIVKPRQPFHDWLNTVFPDEKEDNFIEENNIYLIREMDNNDQIKRWIKSNFDLLFINELNDWYTDESKWPAKRTYKMFAEWFDVEVHSMVLDLEDSPLEKE